MAGVAARAVRAGGYRAAGLLRRMRRGRSLLPGAHTRICLNNAVRNRAAAPAWAPLCACVHLPAAGSSCPYPRLMQQPDSFPMSILRMWRPKEPVIAMIPLWRTVGPERAAHRGGIAAAVLVLCLAHVAGQTRHCFVLYSRTRARCTPRRRRRRRPCGRAPAACSSLSVPRRCLIQGLPQPPPQRRSHPHPPRRSQTSWATCWGPRTQPRRRGRRPRRR